MALSLVRKTDKVDSHAELLTRNKNLIYQKIHQIHNLYIQTVYDRRLNSGKDSASTVSAAREFVYGIIKEVYGGALPYKKNRNRWQDLTLESSANILQNTLYPGYY